MVIFLRHNRSRFRLRKQPARGDAILTDRPYETCLLAERPVIVAPDGSEVRPLLELEAGGTAHFSLAPGKVSKAVLHKTVEEIWYIISGRGEMWRSNTAAKVSRRSKPA